MVLLRSSYSWLAVLLVCRHWYYVGKNYDLLWTTFTVSAIRSQSFVQMALRRSQHAPLSVIFIDRTPHREGRQLVAFSMLHELLSRQERVQHLFATINDLGVYALLIGQLDHFRPKLRSCNLDIRNARTCCRPVMLREHSPLRFPPHHLDLSALRALRVSGRHDDITLSSTNIQRIRSLVSLEIHHTDLTLASLLACLDGLCSLQALRLEAVRTIYDPREQAPEPLPVVELKSLRTCHLNCVPHVCASLMTRLRLPPSATITLDYMIKMGRSWATVGPAATVFAPLLPFVDGSSLLEPPRPVRTLSLHYGNGFTSIVRGYALAASDVELQPAMFTLETTSPCGLTQVARSGFPLQNVEVLIIEADLEQVLRRDDWPDVVAAWTVIAPSLVELRLHLQWGAAATYQRVLDALRDPPSDAVHGGPDIRRVLLCPSLKRGVLSGTSCIDVEYIDGVKEVLDARVSAGYPRLSRIAVQAFPKRELPGPYGQNPITYLSGCADEVVLFE